MLSWYGHVGIIHSWCYWFAKTPYQSEDMAMEAKITVGRKNLWVNWKTHFQQSGLQFSGGLWALDLSSIGDTSVITILSDVL